MAEQDQDRASGGTGRQGRKLAAQLVAGVGGEEGVIGTQTLSLSFFNFGFLGVGE